MRRATGTRKNLLLTLWLLLPFTVLAGIIAVIFLSYGKQKMDARPVGQGARDTGGANALGEILAGNDPIEQEQLARDLREGRLVDPLAWPHGVRILLPRNADQTRHLLSWDGASPPAELLACPPASRCEHDLSADDLDRLFSAARPGAGLYLSSTSDVSVSGTALTDGHGTTLATIPLVPVPITDTTEGLPIQIEAVITGD